MLVSWLNVFKRMTNKDSKTKFIDRIKYKYRLSIYRDETYEEVLNLKLSRLNVFAIGGAILFLFMTLIVSVIVYTPVREFIPGYPDENTFRNIVSNNQQLDSLELELIRRDRYFDNIKTIIMGEEPNNYENSEDTSSSYESITFTRSTEDSLIRQFFEDNEVYSMTVTSKRSSISNISHMHFFPPVKGLVTNGFNTESSHYGADIVSGANEVVKTTLDGTITMATWTLQTGWV